MIPSKGLGNVSARPSQREVHKKLAEAALLIGAGKWFPLDAVKLYSNFADLEKEFGTEVTTHEDQTKLLVAALEEIRTEDYAGSHPPQRSYEKAVLNAELFAFCWESPLFQKAEMYFKFCFWGADKQKKVCVFSIHRSTGKK